MSNFSVERKLCADQEQHQIEVDEERLAIACGIVDQKLLKELLAAEITPNTLTALSLFPAVYVAWANGYVERAERTAVLDAAHKMGIEKETPAHNLLECWMDQKPGDTLVTAWKDFIHASRPQLSDAAFAELREAALKRARDIASAAGGILGFGSISAKERAAIAELEQVFADAPAEKESAAS